MPFTGTVAATADDPFQRSYKGGSQHGEWVEVDSKGLVKSKSIYENGQLQSRGNWKDGKKHGLEEYFNKDGSLESSKTYENDVEVTN